MLKQVKEFFHGEQDIEVNSDELPSSKELRLAVGILLLEMAGTDADYAPEEVKTIFLVLSKTFRMSEFETMELLEIADAARTKKSQIDEYIRTINKHLSPEHRTKVLAMLWKVIYADGKVEQFEERFAVQMKFRLQLTDEQAKAAHQMAKRNEI